MNVSENLIRQPSKGVDNQVVKGTWQRGGFSGVFAEIGSA
jgi:hypothetical protein